MNIFLVTTIYEEAGGTKNLIDDITEKLMSKGHTVSIICVFPRYEKKILFQGPRKNITYLNHSDDINILNTLDRFVKEVNTKKPYRLYFFLGHGIMLMLIAVLSETYKKKSILYYLDPWFTIPDLKNKLEKYSNDYKQLRDRIASNQVTSRFWKKIRPFELLAGHDSPNAEFYKSVKNIILCTNDMIIYFSKKLDVPVSKIKFIPLYARSIYNKKINVNKIERDFKDRPDSNKRIVFVGRVSSSWKGFWIILEALKELKDFSLVLYTVSPSEIELAKELLEYYKIDKNRVKFYLGKKDEEVFKAMYKTDILVLPSLAEGFSFVMVECMGVGGTVVAGPIYGGPLEVISNGKNGFLFKAGSSKSLIETIRKISKMDRDELLEIKRRAQKRASEYTFDLFWSRLSSSENY